MLDAPAVSHSQKRPGGKIARWDNGLVWENVAHEHITSFLGTYKTHEDAYKANSGLVHDFIMAMVKKEELTKWTVVVLSGRPDSQLDAVDIGNFKIKPVERTEDKRATKGDDRYIIRRLLSPRDEAIDLNQEAYEAALAQTRAAAVLDPARGEKRRKPEDIDEPNGPAIRHIRGLGSEEFNVPPHPERGLLMIYPIDSSGIANVNVPIIAIGISFPGSQKSATVKYQVNNVYWEQEVGGGELP
jgi:hypothetical protein